MLSTSTTFVAEVAPCGHMRDGRRHQENDDEGLSIDDRTYVCGCRMIRHEYHDGSIRIKTTHHNGKVLKDEHSADHEA